MVLVGPIDGKYHIHTYRVFHCAFQISYSKRCQNRKSWWDTRYRYIYLFIINLFVYIIIMQVYTLYILNCKKKKVLNMEYLTHKSDTNVRVNLLCQKRPFTSNKKGTFYRMCFSKSIGTKKHFIIKVSHRRHSTHVYNEIFFGCQQRVKMIEV